MSLLNCLVLHPVKGDPPEENTIQNSCWWPSGGGSQAVMFSYLGQRVGHKVNLVEQQRPSSLRMRKHKGKTVIMLGIEPCYILFGNSHRFSDLRTCGRMVNSAERGNDLSTIGPCNSQLLNSQTLPKTQTNRMTCLPGK